MSASDRPRARQSPPDLADSPRPARIVVADDDRLSRELLASILRNAGHSVDAVEDGQQAVERVGAGGVDLVLLDVVMPRLNGIEACRLLKGMTLDTFLPVVLVTVKTDTASRVEGLRIGADDYVCKPFEEAELLARVQNMLRIKRLHEQITQQKARFERLSVHDELTGLYNFRFLHTRLNEEFKRAERYHEPFACMLIDIDQLRAVNDVGGRAAGDLAIRRVADGIRRCVREVDVVARYGGEEFLVVLPSTHFAGSVVVAERVWREVGSRPLDLEISRPDADRRTGSSSVDDGARAPQTPRETAPARKLSGAVDAADSEGGRISVVGIDPRWSEGPRSLTVSIGVALYPSRDVRTKDALIRAAEAALAQAKREGGNRVCVFQQQGYIYSPSFAPNREAPPGASAPARGAQDGPPSTRAPRGAQDGPPSTRAPRSGQDGPPSTRAPRGVGPDSWRPSGPDSEGGRRGA